MAPLLELRQITCQFPGPDPKGPPVLANDQVDLIVEAGQVHALLGENGAGKSTLMKVAFGIHPPTSGQCLWRGKPVQFRSVADAMAVGIGMVHQHFMLIPSFRVWENIVLGHEPTRRGQVDAHAARQKVAALSKEYGLHVDPDALVSDLSVGQQQRIEILKALYRDIDLLILDEPTAVLTPQESDELFATLRRLIDDGLTAIFISHKLREVKAIADHVTILRRGRKVLDAPIDQYDIEGLATEMVGRPPAPPPRPEMAVGAAIALDIQGLQVLDNRGKKAIHKLDLSLHQGEILGIAGVEGNGQSELLEAITGARPIQAGTLLLHGQEITHTSIAARLAHGMAHVPEDRQRQGLILEMSIPENLLLGRHNEARYLRHGLWINFDQLHQDTAAQIERFGISPTQVKAGALSGGNQQKVVIAREFQRPAQVLIVAHPTRGVDIGAIEAIHAQLFARQREGASILLISSELSELLALCKRIAVLYEGKIVGICNAKETDESALGVLMTGGQIDEARPHPR